MIKRIKISSSISNFSTGLQSLYYDYALWNFSIFTPTIFFGAYHWLDWLYITIHRGRKKIFFCGSDILNLKKSLWRHIIWRLDAEHVCENEVERAALRELGIEASIHPMFFGKAWDYPVSFTPSQKPTVFMSAHEGREEEYGVSEFLEIAGQCPELEFYIYHGLSKATFDERIKKHQGCVRLNAFDGFSENLAKSILMGQYPISRIAYGDGIIHAETKEEIIAALKSLKDKTEPNPYTEVWRKRLSNKVTI